MISRIVSTPDVKDKFELRIRRKVRTDELVKMVVYPMKIRGYHSDVGVE